MIEIKKHNEGTYRFKVNTSAGNTILESIDFSNIEDIKKSVADLQASINERKIFERKTDHSGKFLFQLKNKDGQLIGSSQLYSSEAGMENGIKNLKTYFDTISNIPEL
ncbi:YegP family protein [Flavobacteriaceae bacterium KMM 6897]|nr:YegP family protein [Flavobacteriaceae bacterium KMM 6897]MEB8345593.1 YegP family protein [Flavobacteriaceae bacterium KMM 6898]